MALVPAAATSSPAAAPKVSSQRSGGIDVAHTVLLGKRTKSSGCVLSANPDPACSPGAYYSKLTKRGLCDPDFHTTAIRNVPVSEKHEVEQEYGLPAKSYGKTLEIDHIVSLELGGSNDIANL